MKTGFLPNLDDINMPKKYVKIFSLACATTLFLGGCKSVGTQYISPLPTQSNATLTTRSNLFATSFDGKGCYSGRTKVPEGDNFLLQPDQEVVITNEEQISRTGANNGFGGFCRIVFSFVPENGAHYTYKVGYVDSVKNALNGICTANLQKNTAEGASEPVAIKYLKMRQRSIACIRAES
jgi:hypothetical protein